MNPEQRPMQKSPVSPENILHIAEELFGENSQTVSDLEVILEEGEENPKVLDARIKEVRRKILAYMMLADEDKRLSEDQRTAYLKRLGFSSNEAIDEMHKLQEEMGGDDFDDEPIHPSKLN